MSEDFNQTQYEQSTPISDKFLRSSGAVEDNNGNTITESSDYNVEQYNQSNPIPDKFLHSDGSVTSFDGTSVQESTDYNKEQYEQAAPIPLKFLHSDGTVDENIGGGGSSSKYHLYAWDYGSGFCIGYTEKEVPVAGDLLFLKQDMEEGKITNPTELKMIYHVVSDSDGVITVSEHPEGQSGYTFTRNPDDDYEETISSVRDCVDIAQDGLLISQKGTVFKALNVNVGSPAAAPKLYCWYNADAVDKTIYAYSLTPALNKIYCADSSLVSLRNIKDANSITYSSNGNLVINAKYGISTKNFTYSRQSSKDINL